MVIGDKEGSLLYHNYYLVSLLAKWLMPPNKNFDDFAVDSFKEYLRVKSVQPKPDYEGCVQFLKRVPERKKDSSL